MPNKLIDTIWMNPMYRFERLAKDMLGIPINTEIPSDLYRRLNRVDELCRLAGHQLMSVDVIASIITTWEAELNQSSSSNP